MKKYLLLISVLFLTACGAPKIDEAEYKSQVPERPAFEDRVVLEDGQTAFQVGREVNRFTPFYPQAPDADWGLPWKEACEEASLILAHYGMLQEDLSQSEFKQLILDMVEWQEANFGFYEDTTVEQTQDLYAGFFDDAFETKILENPNLNDIKWELIQGNLIVAPFAGRMLGNPFYSGDGPYYHMMVIKGFDGTNFITSDVGTKRGKDYIYPYRDLMKAIHDFRPENIENGPSRVIVLVAEAEEETPSQEL